MKNIKQDSQDTKVLKPRWTNYYSINIRLLAQMLMLQVSTFL
jgi:hypothetical protein